MDRQVQPASQVVASNSKSSQVFQPPPAWEACPSSELVVRGVLCFGLTCQRFHLATATVSLRQHCLRHGWLRGPHSQPHKGKPPMDSWSGAQTLHGRSMACAASPYRLACRVADDTLTWFSANCLPVGLIGNDLTEFWDLWDPRNVSEFHHWSSEGRCFFAW